MDDWGNRSKVIDALLMTKREGIGELIDWMDDNNFFTSPCSGKHHLCVEGGLAEHSLNVRNTMRDLCNTLCEVSNRPSEQTITIVSLLHDLGKCGDHGKENYVINMVKDGKPTKAEPEQKYKQSEAEPYKTNPDLLYIPHEIRSIAIAERFIQLTEEEEFAILYHNGLYGDLKYSFNGKETPLSLMLHWADMWVSRVTEIEKKGEEE